MGLDSNLQKHVDALVIILDDQIRVYRHLLEIVRKEKDILVAANLDELNENNRSKEAMLIKVRILEAQRIEAANALATALNKQVEEPRLLELARFLDEESGDKLRNIHSVLELLLRRVQEYNRQNEALVQSALHSITGAMNALKGTLSERPTYQRDGEVDGQLGAGQLVRREV